MDSTLLRTFVLAAFAMWFGGFGFYVSIVVPIGTEVLGSAMDQGMITRQVTVWLNIFCAIALVAMFADLLVTWSGSSAAVRWSLSGLSLVILVLLVALFILHPMLDRMIDVESKTTSDAALFYNLHRVYLWASTIQWMAAWAWLLIWVSEWVRSNRPIRAADAL